MYILATSQLYCKKQIKNLYHGFWCIHAIRLVCYMLWYTNCNPCSNITSWIVFHTFVTHYHESTIPPPNNKSGLYVVTNQTNHFSSESVTSITRVCRLWLTQFATISAFRFPSMSVLRLSCTCYWNKYKSLDWCQPQAFIYPETQAAWQSFTLNTERKKGWEEERERKKGSK